MSPFLTLLLRDLRLAARSGGGAALALAFFALVATLVPLGVGADLKLLARVAGGVLWVAAVLAALLSLDRLFQGDFEDGSLDLIALSPLPLEADGAGQDRGALAVHRPAADLAVAAAGAAVRPAAAPAPWSLFLSLLIGTPAVSAVGAIGASLTLSLQAGRADPAPDHPAAAGAGGDLRRRRGGGGAGRAGQRQRRAGASGGFSAGRGAAKSLRGRRQRPPQSAVELEMQLACSATPIPHNFMRLSGALLPFTAIAAALCLGAGPVSRLHRAARLPAGHAPSLIMFIHVPAAIMAMTVYGAIAVVLAAVAGLAPSPGRYRRARRRAPGRAVHGAGPDHRRRSGASRCGAPIGCGTRG